MQNIKSILLSALILVITSCGGGGGSSSPTPTPATIISGIASAGIIKGGTVKIFTSYSSLTGADKKQLGNTVQSSLNDGYYSVNIGYYTGPVIVEVTGGSYVDEATGTTVLGGIPSTAPLRAAMGNVSGAVNISVTPLTELAVKQAKALDKKLGAASLNKANGQISDLFKVDIIATKPLDASNSINTGTSEQKDYTLILAAISQLAKSSAQTLDTTLTGLVGNIDNTGIMNAVAGDNVKTALSNFIADGTNNKTGVSSISDNLKIIGKTTLRLTIALTGSGVKSVETILNLPPHVTVPSDSTNTNAPLEGYLSQLINGTNTYLGGNVSSVNALHVILNNGDQHFTMPVGDIIMVKVIVDAGFAPPDINAFTLNNTKLKDGNGVIVNGANIILH